MVLVQIAGVDEAGKGPVLGPMCVAGVMTSDVAVLEGLGLRDSKKLAPVQRERLVERIRECVDRVFVLEVSAMQIDEFRRVMSMNDVMVLCFARVLEELQPDVAYLDAADVNPQRFARRIGERCGRRIEIISEHGADARYSVVSAASIVAKVRRDELMRELREETGLPLGSGYPSDPETKRFLREWIRVHDDFPSFVRKSWKTASSLLDGKLQRRL
jgi:ribonuclease HII